MRCPTCIGRQNSIFERKYFLQKNENRISVRLCQWMNTNLVALNMCKENKKRNIIHKKKSIKMCQQQYNLCIRVLLMVFVQYLCAVLFPSIHFSGLYTQWRWTLNSTQREKLRRNKRQLLFPKIRKNSR